VLQGRCYASVAVLSITSAHDPCRRSLIGGERMIRRTTSTRRRYGLAPGGFPGRLHSWVTSEVRQPIPCDRNHKAS